MNRGTSDARAETVDAATAASLSPRDRILRAAARLLAEGGREAVSTRAVSAAADVQPPTIYRQFGDMQGLLDAVADEGFARYVLAKVTREGSGDPVAELRAGWDAHVAFGLANPALYALMYGDPRPGAVSPAAAESQRLLELLVRRVAEAGRLRVGVEVAARMIHAGALGVVLTLIAADAGTEGNRALSTSMREAVLGAVIADAPSRAEPTAGPERVAARAVALKAVLPEAGGAFTPAEGDLLVEWLDRLSGQRWGGPATPNSTNAWDVNSAPQPMVTQRHQR